MVFVCVYFYWLDTPAIMPRVKIDYVVSFSSEDKDNRASNLLSWEVGAGRWLCAAGQPSCSVVLQLARAVQISCVQLGAHQAAFVEVLVGRSEIPHMPYEVLVPSSLLQSPREARAPAAAAAERVRSFSGAALAAAAAQRWDRVRVVCSQPYNKHCKYGISFIHMFEPDGPSPPPPLPADSSSSSDDEFRPGALFAKHRQSSGSTSADTGAQIRQATSQALKYNSDTGTKLLSKREPTASPSQEGPLVRRWRDKDDLMYTKDDEQPHAKIDHIVQRHKDEKTKHEAKTPNSKANETGDKGNKRTESKTGESSNRNADKDEPPSPTHSERKRDSYKFDGKKDGDGSRGHNKNETTSNDGASTGTNANNRRERDKFDEKIERDNRQSRNRNETNNIDEPSTSRDTELGRNKRDARRDRPDNSRRNDTPDINDATKESRKRLRSDGDESENVVGGGAQPGPECARPLSGVVLALSGYAAERRRALRELAVALGARYAPVWGAACTHLVCAFPNTPKLREARRSGAHVPVCTGEWLEASARRRRALPWRWFATEPRERVAPPPASPPPAPAREESDTDDEIEKVLQRQKRSRVASPAAGAPAVQSSPAGAPSRDSDVTFVKDERMQGHVSVSDSDSDSELTETEAEAAPPSPSPSGRRAASPSPRRAPLAGCAVALDARLAHPFDVPLLARYVRAYGGRVCTLSEVEEESSEQYYILCGSRAAARASPAPAARRVRADWLWECHRARRLVDTRPYQ